MRKNLKKFASFLIVLMIIATLTGCGKDKKSETKEEKISVGVWESNVYTNDFLDIKYTNPIGWVYSSEEELAKIMNISLDMVGELTDKNSDYIKEIAKQITVYYLATNNPSTGDNVQVVTEKMLMDVTEEYYLNNLIDQFNKMEVIKYEVLGTSDEKLGKYDYKVLTLKAKDYNINQKVYIRKKGDYIINIILTSTTGADNLTEMAKCFE